MKIAFFELEPWQKDIVQQQLQDHELIFIDDIFRDEHIQQIKDVHIVSVFIYSTLPKNVIEQLPNLQCIVTMSTGFDHIDIAYAKEKNIPVCNVPTYGENTVAEHAFALLLTLSRKMYQCIKRTHELHEFITDHSLRGFDVKDKTLGLVGCGNIGIHMAKMALGFNMKVIVFDPRQNEELAQKTGFSYVDMDTLLKESDVISLHAPYNQHTHHLINAQAIEKMKPTAILINTARGGLIDTHALVKALEQKRIAGAGLDVLEQEKEVKEELNLLTIDPQQAVLMLEDHLLMKLDNVIVTPHNAFNTQEALERILQTTLDNIKAFAQQQPTNKVN